MKLQKIVVRSRSRGMALRPVHRIKHVVDRQFAVTGAGAQNSTTLISSVDAPVLANTAEVETGSKVNGIYLKVEIVNIEATQGVLPNAYLLVAKNPGNNIVVPNANVVGASDNKRFVIHQEMVMLQKQSGSNPRILFNGVIVIPRGYRRFGPNDQLVAAVLSPGVDLDACLQCHYKEFR